MRWGEAQPCIATMQQSLQEQSTVLTPRLGGAPHAGVLEARRGREGALHRREDVRFESRVCVSVYCDIGRGVPPALDTGHLPTPTRGRYANPQLATLATQVRLDAFTKVKAAIDDMIAALLKEKADEIKHKDFCPECLNTNERETELKQRDIEELEAKISDLTTQIDELTKAIATLESEIAEMQTQLKRAGEDRELENKDFQQVVADQRETQQLLSKALLLAVELAGCGFHDTESHRYENDALRVQRETHGRDERTRNQKEKNTEDIMIV